MKRVDVCPSCGTSLRYEPPDDYGMDTPDYPNEPMYNEVKYAL